MKDKYKMEKIGNPGKRPSDRNFSNGNWAPIHKNKRNINNKNININNNANNKDMKFSNYKNNYKILKIKKNIKKI